jgi:hypothetical protein
MYLVTQDAKRLITFALHVGEALTDAEVDNVVATIDGTAKALAASPSAFATTVVVVETDHGPNAKQRKRIGEALKKLDRHVQVLITSSVVVRAIMTAIRWFTPATPHNHSATFATYPEACVWLVQRTGYKAEVFDTMLAELRKRARAR